MSREDLLVGYVAAALDRVDSGEEPDLAEICKDHPDLIDAVAEALGFDPERTRAAASSAPPGNPLGNPPGNRLGDPPGNPLAGRILGGRYELGECIGLGAMGAVHAAVDRTLDRRVAVKIMHAGMFPDASRQERFVREAKVLAALSERHVVPIHDQGQADDGTFYLVMDLLEGTSLAGVLQFAVERGLDPHDESFAAAFDVQMSERSYLRQVVAWAAQLARGLAAAHAASVVHRDVKPSNVFVERDGQAVLLDFGIAVREGDAALTAADTTLGTPWYMAPEQTVAGTASGSAVDVYGLGATLYHLLTGQPPHDGDAAAVIFQLRTEDPVPPHKLAPTLPRDLCAIVEKSLERRPGDRYASMDEFAADLDAFLDHRPVVARPLTRVGRLARAARRRPARAFAIGAGLLLLPLGVAAWWSLAVIAASRDDARYDELFNQVPALVCLEGYPEKRILEDMTESNAAVAVLSEMLELKPDDVATRIMRASLRLDRGERAAARADLRDVERRLKSPYATALRAAYENAGDTARGAASLDLSALPEPNRPIEWFLAGFHTLRLRRDYELAHAQLGRAATTLLIARDLRQLTFLMLGFLARDRATKVGYFEKAYAEALQLEGIYGRKTARTRHTIGAALVGLRRYEKAIEPLRESLALRPDRHGPIHNLGIAMRRTGRLDAAEKYLERAHELRPWLWNTLYTLAQVQCDRGEFAAAMRLAEQIPATGSMGEAWQRPLLMARVHLNHAFQCLRQADPAGSRGFAAQAAPRYDVALANGCREKNAALAERHLAHELASGKTTPVNFLASWRKDLQNPLMLLNLEKLLAEEKSADAETLLWLRVYLLRLAADLAADDPRPRQRLRHVIKGGKSP